MLAILSGGTPYNWNDDHDAARGNAESYYQNTEGIDVSGSEIFLSAMKKKERVSLDLDDINNYTAKSAVSGLLDGALGQLQRLLEDMYSQLLYFCEARGVDAGIHGRDESGLVFTILECLDEFDETTDFAFSPNGQNLQLVTATTCVGPFTRM
jgi:hypothetical protein